MIKIKKHNMRGHADHGWLRSYHTFSFAEYYDPENMAYEAIRVINEDYIKPGYGFGMHPHKDMEIVTVMLSGELQHKDNLGNTDILRSGQIQVMTAGTGIVHAESNSSLTDVAHLYQIWIYPAAKNLVPSYHNIDYHLKNNELILLAANTGDKVNVGHINQDVNLKIGQFDVGKTHNIRLSKNRKYWIQVMTGQMTCEKQELVAGDAIITEQESELSFTISEISKILVFEL